MQTNQATAVVKIGVTENFVQEDMKRKQWIQIMGEELARVGQRVHV